MEEKYVEIDLMKYIPLDSYVTLDQDLKRKILKVALEKANGITNLGRILGIERRTISTWLYNKRKRIPLGGLIKIANYIGTDIEVIRKNLKDITAYLDIGAVSIKDLKLILNEDLSEWLGLIKGDGCVAYNGIWCFNTELDILLFFAQMCERLFNVDKNKIRISIRTTDGVENYKLSAELLRKGYKNIRFEKQMGFGKSSTKPLFCFFLGSIILSKIIKGIMRDLKEILKKSDSKVKAAYIRGFSAAEGCVSRRKIWLVNKDKEELEFIKKLLLDLKITSIGPKFKKGGVFHLYISGKDNLLKFSKFVTFGKHQIRNERLYKTLSSFSLLNRNERIEKILKVLDSPKTTKDISKLIGIKYSWTSLTLKDMVMKGILDTNNARRDRVYFVSSDEKC